MNTQHILLTIVTVLDLVNGDNIQRLESKVRLLETYMLEELLYLRRGLDRTQADMNEILDILNNTKVVQEDQANRTKEVTDLDRRSGLQHLHSEIQGQLLRVRRAFKDEKTVLKSAISDLNSTSERLKSSVEILMQSVVNTFQAMETNLSLSTMALEHSTETHFDRLQQNIDMTMNKSTSEMLKTQENILVNMDSTFQTSINNMQFQTNISMSQNLKSMDNKMDAISTIIDSKLEEIKNLNANKYSALQQKVDLLFSLLSDGYYGMERNLNVRLANVSFDNLFFGRLEVYHEGKWGTVCDDSFEDVDATVICRMFGFNRGTAYIQAKKGRGSENMPIWLDDVECSGSETSIFSCTHSGHGKHNCNHGEDAAVRCYN